jgi:two-component system OmpR family response regulator
VTLDLSAGLADRKSRPLPLTGIEFRILAALMRNQGQLVSYAQLAEAVWAAATGPDSNSLEVHVSRIRQKLEEGGASRQIQTVRGLGYRFVLG